MLQEHLVFKRIFWLKLNKMKKMKIALVYDAIYPYIKGGEEKRFDEIGKRLAKKGHQVHLYGMKLCEGHDVIQKEGLYLHGICPPKPLYTKDGRRSTQQAVFFGIHCLNLSNKILML
jgi:hypothetical protein